MMRIYRDGLGHEYRIADRDVEAFERRRTPLLVAKIAVQVIVLAGLLTFGWMGH